jgi:hypothetical protein
MNGMGNNGNGSRLGRMMGWFSSLLRVERNDPNSVKLGEMNYMNQLKRSGGI